MQTLRQSLCCALLMLIAVCTFAQTGDMSGGMSGDAQAVFGTYFLNGDGYRSTLMLRNQRPDVTITVNPSLLLADGREVGLDPRTLAPHAIVTIDLYDELISRGLRSVKSGSVAIEYTFGKSGAIQGSISIENEKAGLYMASLVRSRLEQMGTRLESVYWFPNAGTRGFIALVNTTMQTRHANLSFNAPNGTTLHFKEIKLAGHDSVQVPIDQILAHYRLGGFTLASDGEPSDVLAEGELFNRHTGFTKRIFFNDLTLEFADNSLRTQFLLLGSQDPDCGFKPGVFFRSVAVVRNIAQKTVRLRPSITYQHLGKQHTIALHAISVGGRTTTTIDFTALQDAGAIPRNFQMGTLTLSPDIPNSIVGELTNYDADGAYVVGPSFTAKAGRGAGASWRTDTDWQTLITLTNAASKSDEIAADFFYDGGVYHAPRKVLAPGEVFTFNARDFTDGSQSGRLPASQGYFMIHGSHGTKSSIVMEALVYSTSTSDYIGLPSNPSVYINVAAGYDPADNGDGTYKLMIECEWSDGSITYETPNNGATSSDPSTAWIVNNGFYSFAVSNSAASGALVNFDYQLYGPGCDAYSYSVFYIRLPIKIGRSYAAYTFTNATQNPDPEGSPYICNYTPVVPCNVKCRGSSAHLFSQSPTTCSTNAYSLDLWFAWGDGPTQYVCVPPFSANPGLLDGAACYDDVIY